MKLEACLIATLLIVLGLLLATRSAPSSPRFDLVQTTLTSERGERDERPSTRKDRP